MSFEQRFGGGEEIQAMHIELGAEHSGRENSKC